MVGSKAAKSVNCIREEKRQLASEDRTRSRVRREIRSRRACHRPRAVIFMRINTSQSGRLARPSSSFNCILFFETCSISRGAGKFVRSPSDSAHNRSSSRGAGSCPRLLLRFNAFIESLAKRFEFSFIFENVYFAKPLLDERVLAQDVDSSLAAVALRQREWVRQESTSAIESESQEYHRVINV